MSVEILNPVRSVKLAAGELQVRELNWRDALEFMAKLSKHAGALFDEKGSVTLDLEKLGSLVMGTKEVADHLLMKATGREQEWVDGLSLSEALVVIDAALELNLSPELIARGKKVAGRVQGAFGREGRVATSAQPSIS